MATRTAPLYGVDDAVVPVDFSFGFAGVERIRRIEIRGPVATTLPGYAIDNLAYASDGFGNGENTDHVQIPVPLWATLVGLAGLGLIGWRHVDRAAARPG